MLPGIPLGHSRLSQFPPSTRWCILQANRLLGGGQTPKNAAVLKAGCRAPAILPKRWQVRRSVRECSFRRRPLDITAIAAKRHCAKKVLPATAFFPKYVARGRRRLNPHPPPEYVRPKCGLV